MSNIFLGSGSVFFPSAKSGSATLGLQDIWLIGRKPYYSWYYLKANLNLANILHQPIKFNMTKTPAFDAFGYRVLLLASFGSETLILSAGNRNKRLLEGKSKSC